MAGLPGASFMLTAFCLQINRTGALGELSSFILQSQTLLPPSEQCVGKGGRSSGIPTVSPLLSRKSFEKSR